MEKQIINLDVEEISTETLVLEALDAILESNEHKTESETRVIYAENRLFDSGPGNTSISNIYPMLQKEQ